MLWCYFVAILSSSISIDLEQKVFGTKVKFFVWNFSFGHSHLVANILEQDHAQKRYISISACLFENEADFEISNSCHRIFETISVLKMHLNTIFTIFYYFSFVIMIVKTQKKKIFSRRDVTRKTICDETTQFSGQTF